MIFKNFLQHRESGPILGQRHLQVFMLFTSIVVNYIVRYSAGITVVAIDEEAKKHPKAHNSTKWTEMEKSYVLSSFFWGYCLTQFLGGYLCRRFGVKKTIFISTFGSSALGLLPPAFGGSWVAFCVVRTIQGLFQGFLFPAIHAHLAAWCPKSEHNRLGAVANSGVDCGIILSMYVSGIIAASSLGWPGILYISGGAGLAWCILWLVFAANTPKESRLISVSELNYIEESKAAAQNTTMENNMNDESKIPVPWKAIWTSVPFLALNVTRAAENFGLVMLISELPSYMNGVLGLDMNSNAVFSALPYVIMLIMSYVYLISSDLLMAYGVITLNILRKTFNSIAFFSPAIGLFLVGYLDKAQSGLAITLIVISVGLNAGHTIGSTLNTLDLSPNHAGVLMGICNTVASIVPIIVPLIVGIFVTDITDREHWQIVFIITSTVYVVGNIVYLIAGSTHLQPWDARDFLTKNEVQNEKNLPAEDEKQKHQDQNTKL